MALRRRNGKWIDVEIEVDVADGESERDIRRLSDEVLLKRAQRDAERWRSGIPQPAPKKIFRKRIFKNRQANKPGPLGKTWQEYWKNDYKKRRQNPKQVEKDRERARRLRKQKHNSSK